MPCPEVPIQQIFGTECIGDSLPKINNNFTALGDATCNLITDVNALSAAINVVDSKILKSNILNGFVYTWVSDTQIQISPGISTSDDQVLTFSTNSTLNLSTSAIGVNGLQSAVQGETTYYLYVIYNPQTEVVAPYAHSSQTVTLPSGFLYKRLIGSFYVDYAKTIVPFVQTGEGTKRDFWFGFQNTVWHDGSVQVSGVTYTYNSTLNELTITKSGHGLRAQGSILLRWSATASNYNDAKTAMYRIKSIPSANTFVVNGISGVSYPSSGTTYISYYALGGSSPLSATAGIDYIPTYVYSKTGATAKNTLNLPYILSIDISKLLPNNAKFIHLAAAGSSIPGVDSGYTTMISMSDSNVRLISISNHDSLNADWGLSGSLPIVSSKTLLVKQSNSFDIQNGAAAAFNPSDNMNLEMTGFQFDA